MKEARSQVVSVNVHHVPDSENGTNIYKNHIVLGKSNEYL